jgi:NAD(P)-dependent dehydrogenase (short-subunit alcohol dehydrogenase family)
MKLNYLQELYDISGKTAVVTGGAGMLCAAMCRALAEAGTKVAVLDLNGEAAESLAAEIRANGGEAIGLACNVLERASIETSAQAVISKYSHVEILINGAGGNKPAASTNTEQHFFDLSADALRWVFDLNLIGTILPSQVFGRLMAEQKSGVKRLAN